MPNGRALSAIGWENGLKQRLAGKPQPINSLVATIVFTKALRKVREFKRGRTNGPHRRSEYPPNHVILKHPIGGLHEQQS
jgi:hypothetical protein